MILYYIIYLYCIISYYFIFEHHKCIGLEIEMSLEGISKPQLIKN